MLEFDQVTKYIRDKIVLNKISAKCRPGEILGIIGPHSSGKSTLLRILAGVLDADSGEILFNKEKLTKKQFNKIGYLPEERALYSKPTVIEIIKYFASLHGLNKHQANIEAIRNLDRFQLIDKSKHHVFQLRKAEVQKLEIITALIHDPDIIILDEPFKGLDINNQLLLKSILLSMQKANKIIVIGSHNIDLMQSIADNIILLNEGEAILSGNASHILDQYREDYITLQIEENDENEAFLLSRTEVVDYYKIDDEIRLFLRKETDKQKIP
jgi:ABC-2 type transport system ATP-binding protein